MTKYEVVWEQIVNDNYNVDRTHRATFESELEALEFLVDCDDLYDDPDFYEIKDGIHIREHHNKESALKRIIELLKEKLANNAPIIKPTKKHDYFYPDTVDYTVETVDVTEDELMIIMPFGKYKGKNIKDVSYQYLEWLSHQDWVEEKYSNIYKYLKDNQEVIIERAYNESVLKDLEGLQFTDYWSND